MTRLVVLVPGGKGQLGAGISALGSDDVEIVAPSRTELDITHTGMVTEAVAALKERARETGRSAIVVNAATDTAVDAIESREDLAFKVNAEGPRVIAAACAAQQVPLVHVSTDYVFSGEANSPYRPHDPIAPRTAYGRTKAAGEEAVLGSGASAWIVRTAWTYGIHGTNFVKTMCRLARERDTLSVVDDQRGTPTWTADLAGGLLQLCSRIADNDGPAERVLHCTNTGETTWFSFAQAIFAELGLDPNRVKPCTSQEFVRPAPRPAYSVLSPEAWRMAGLDQLRPWRDALAAFMAAHRDELANAN